MARVEVLGCPIDAVTMSDAVERVGEAVAERRTCQHVAINAAKLVKFQHDPELRKAILGCELITADGQAVVWASRLLGQRLPERVAGIDLMHELLEAAARQGHGVFLLGARAEVLAESRGRDHAAPAGAAGGRATPRLLHARRRGGCGRRRHRRREPRSPLRRARDSRQRVVSRTASRAASRSRSSWVSAARSTCLAGVRRRAPVVFRRLGLEWLYRLAQDPRRLAGRYVVGNSRFILLVARAVARGR